jgi:hypothetical protein
MIAGAFVCMALAVGLLVAAFAQRSGAPLLVLASLVLDAAAFGFLCAALAARRPPRREARVPRLPAQPR